MVKIVPIIIMALGVLGIILALTPLLASVPLISKLSKTQLLIASVVVIIIGALLMKSKTKQKSTEVPIFHGQSQQVVGYRRQ